MDPETLREATEEWVDAGLIDADQAAAIRTYETDQGDDDGRSRLVTAFALMGGLLVAAGIALYVAGTWDAVPRAVRSLVLVAAPTAGYLAARRLVARDRARVGHGLRFGSTAFLGATAFLHRSMYAPDADPVWFLAAWFVAALVAGHAFRSRYTTALGLLLAGATTFGVAETLGAEAFVPVAAVGALAFAAGSSRRLGPRPAALAGTYRVVGVALTVAGLLPLVAVGLDVARLDAGGVLAALIPVAAVAGIALRAEAAGPADRSVDGATRVRAAWVLGVAAALAVVWLVFRFGGDPPRFAAEVLGHALLLSVLVGAVAAGVLGRDRGVVNVVAVGFLLQLAAFLETTVGRALPRSLALVVAGVVLLAAGLALERGRRELFARMA